MRLKNHLLKLALMPVLALAVTVGACSDDATKGNLTAPEQADFARGGGKRFHKVEVANPNAMTVTAEIDSRGGVLRADEYFLAVPRNAVRGKTTFTMEVSTDGVVSLTAIETRGRVWVDVGANGFREKLTVGLSYGRSREAKASALDFKVVWLKDNGNVVVMPSLVDERARIVYGELSHFSRYALAEPRDDSSDF